MAFSKIYPPPPSFLFLVYLFQQVMPLNTPRFKSFTNRVFDFRLQEIKENVYFGTIQSKHFSLFATKLLKPNTYHTNSQH